MVKDFIRPCSTAQEAKATRVCEVTAFYRVVINATNVDSTRSNDWYPNICAAPSRYKKTDGERFKRDIYEKQEVVGSNGASGSRHSRSRPVISIHLSSNRLTEGIGPLTAIILASPLRSGTLAYTRVRTRNGSPARDVPFNRVFVKNLSTPARTYEAGSTEDGYHPRHPITGQPRLVLPPPGPLVTPSAISTRATLA